MICIVLSTFADVRCSFLYVCVYNYIYIIFIFNMLYICIYIYIFVLASLLEKPGVLPAAKLSELKPEMVLEKKVVRPV